MPAAIPVVIAAASSIGAAAVSAWAAGTAFTLTTAVLAKAAFAAALAMASSALSGKPKASSGGASFQSSARDRKVTIRNSTSERRIVYGETKLSGVLAYAETTGSSNKDMHLVLPVAGHEVESIGQVYFNATPAADERFNGKYSVNKHLGSINQAADADLVSVVSDWTDDHKGQGVAYIYSKLTQDNTAFPNGLPNISVLVKGRKVFDPRKPQISLTTSFNGVFNSATDHGLSVGDSVWIYDHRSVVGTSDLVSKEHKIASIPSARSFTLVAPIGYMLDGEGQQVEKPLYGSGIGGFISKMVYSNNPALVVRDYLTGIWGYNCRHSEIDDAFFIAAANTCDERVEINGTAEVGTVEESTFTIKANYKSVYVPDVSINEGGDGGRDTNSGPSDPGDDGGVDV